MAKYYKVGLYKQPEKPTKLKHMQEERLGTIVVQDNTTYASEIITKVKLPIACSNDILGQNNDDFYVKDSELIDENKIGTNEISNYVNAKDKNKTYKYKRR